MSWSQKTQSNSNNADQNESFLQGVDFGEEDEEEWDEIMSRINDFGETTDSRNIQAHTYRYGDVIVNFPYEAYKSQKQIMEKVIEGAYQGENCLIESPTGTGKTAALLCALLAWRKTCVENRYYCQDVAAKSALVLGKCTCGLVKDPNNTKVTIVREKPWHPLRLKAEIINSTTPHDEVNPNESATSDSTAGPRRKVKKTKESKEFCIKNINDCCRYCIRTNLKLQTHPPKIYYATRTHTQISQVIKQLKQTDYANSFMTILSSRQQSCINKNLRQDCTNSSAGQNSSKGNSHREFVHPQGINRPPYQTSANNKESKKESHRDMTKENRHQLDETCRSLRTNFFHNRNQSSQSNSKGSKQKPECPYFTDIDTLRSKFKSLLTRGAWDIEELVQKGKECKKCPYYGSKSLHEEADIIFCPYNYLISPDIREITKVDLANNIIVFDEAHNIEGICCSLASFSITLNLLDKVRTGFDKVIVSGRTISSRKLEALGSFSRVLQRLSSWMINEGKKLKVPGFLDTKKPASLPFFESNIVELFSTNGLGPKELDTHLDFLEILEDYKDDNFKVEGLGFIRELLRVLKFLFQNNMKWLKDYKVALSNTGIFTISSGNQESRRYNYLLDITCLNPGVAFEPIKNAAHSIIVASGTLTPLKFFADELETKFDIKLTTSHVVSPSQVWAGVVKTGPSQQLIKLVKASQDDFNVQDDVGEAILELCEIIPNGVLVFLPSYNFMNKLKARWSLTLNSLVEPLMKRLKKLKVVYFEESNKELFENDLKEYKTNIRNLPGGCILFAVFRGKVSEGIDFADEEARAVITVGIPFANLFSNEVTGKKAYNDKKRRQSLNLSQMPTQDPNSCCLSGQQWYDVQAFRAMNQAFGRCIRHQHDWGAIIMLESRLSQPGYSEYLSKWILTHLKSFESFDTVKNSLVGFIDSRKKFLNASDPIC